MRSSVKYFIIAVAFWVVVDYSTAFNPDWQCWLEQMPLILLFYFGVSTVVHFSYLPSEVAALAIIPCRAVHDVFPGDGHFSQHPADNLPNAAGHDPGCRCHL